MTSSPEHPMSSDKVLYTVSDPDILDFFGWDLYDGEPREHYPASVTASFGLWRNWFSQKLKRDGHTVAFLDQAVKNLLDLCKETA